MASGEGGEKKFSFGFSKSLKKPLLNKNKNVQPEEKVDLIEYLDDKAIKVVGEEEKKDEPLVIPMLGSKAWHERILNKVNADIFEPKVEPTTNGDLNNLEVKQEVTEDTSGTTLNDIKDHPQPIEAVTIKEEKPDEPTQTLEEQAADEILQDLKLQAENAEEIKIDAVPLPEDDSLVGKQESTLEDYEQIPIDKFGEAMLRGMGWQPGKGIGKNEKLVAAVIPELRPRGMGLGADKLMIQKQIAACKLAEEGNLKLVKGGYIKIITGKQSSNYGQIEGLDEDGGRLVIKLALGGNIISVNASMVQAVSKDEYNKNAKVLNSKKYEQYKNKAEKKKSSAPEEIAIDASSEEENEKQERHRNSKSRDRKKSKKHSKYSSDDDSDSDRRSRKRRNSSDSDSDYKRKKSKKTKKHKRRDSSSELFSHKSKRKHKERDRESRDSPKRDKYRHKRSRSRSRRR